MVKRSLVASGLALLSMLGVGAVQPASAGPIDPAFVESLSAGNTCPSNCATVTTGTDPISGKTTLEYIFNSTIPSVVAGDELIREFGSSTIGDVIRFENILGLNGVSSAVAFIFSNDVAGKLTADVGLPAFLTNTGGPITESSSGFAGPFTPSSGQPGYCASCSTSPTYGLTSADIPEPASLAILGASLLGLGLIRRGR